MGGSLPEGELASRISDVKARVAKAMRPLRVWRRVGKGEVPMMGESLRAHLSSCSDVYLVCATLGPGVDSLQRAAGAVSAADALIVQAAGAAFIEKYMDETEDSIRALLLPGESLVSRYSPGYGDWPLEAQRDLLRILDASRTVGVSLGSSLLMAPSKSVSAAIGVKGAP